MTTTCLKAVVGGKQKHALCKKPHFISVEYHVDYKTVTKMRQDLSTLSFVDITGCKQCCLSVFLMSGPYNFHGIISWL